MVLSSVKNLLFDLGGVILNIDPVRVAVSFSRYSNKELAAIRKEIEERQIFQLFESGQWEEGQFRSSIKEVLGVQVSDAQIDQAWTAMLLDIPTERVTLLQQLRKKYKLFLLSNTNAIHLRTIDKILQQSAGIESLEELFDKTYYSFRMKAIKPSAESYRYVLQDSNLLPEETLFIDDSLVNINGAKQLGMQTVHIQAPATILDFFDHA